ncbi:hypothetical protein ACDX78_12885 [Virgibacillus oceani]
MAQKPKKKFELPTEANQDGELGVTNGLKFNHPFQAEDAPSGSSVDEHKKLESANEEIAEKEISQVYNNL